MATRSEWHRTHFESLGYFGVWARGGHGTIFPSRRGPILQSARYIPSLQTTTDPSTLTSVIQAGVLTDGFLSGVLESVKDSDNKFFRNFFLDFNDILCYQRPEDVRARVCVIGTVVKQSCVQLMETASWRDILVLIGRMQRFPMHITGQICSPTWHISYVLVRCALHHFVRSCTVCAAYTHGLSLGWTVHPK